MQLSGFSMELLSWAKDWSKREADIIAEAMDQQDLSTLRRALIAVWMYRRKQQPFWWSIRQTWEPEAALRLVGVDDQRLTDMVWMGRQDLTPLGHELADWAYSKTPEMFLSLINAIGRAGLTRQWMHAILAKRCKWEPRWGLLAALEQGEELIVLSGRDPRWIGWIQTEWTLPPRPSRD